jgi:hypothetical protein
MWHAWGEQRCLQGFWLRRMRERGHMKDLSVDGKIILNGVFKN